MEVRLERAGKEDEGGLTSLLKGVAGTTVHVRGIVWFLDTEQFLWVRDFGLEDGCDDGVRLAVGVR